MTSPLGSAPTSRHTGGDVVAELLHNAKVSVVFGVLSIHNMPIYDALSRRGHVHIVKARTEAGAVNMADAYARVSGGIGVAITSTGTGAGNAAGALVEADTAGSQVLHLTGQIPVPYLDKGRGYIHEARDQLGMLKAVGASAKRALSGDELAAVMRAALCEVQTPLGGPVSIEIPIDVQEKPVSLSVVAPSDGPTPLPGQEMTDKSAIEAVARVLSSNARTLLWSGGGALRGGAAGPLTALAEALGAGVITSAAGRGIIPEDHPLCIGNFGASAPVQELLNEADVLLIVGCRLRANETRGWNVTWPKQVAQVDVDPGAIGRNCDPELSIVGAARPVVTELERLVERSSAPNTSATEVWARRIAAAARAARTEMESTLGPYRELPKLIRRRLSPDTPIVRDVTISTSTWGNRLLPVLVPRTSVHAVGGGIGQGLAMAIGAGLVRPDQEVLLLCGDGGFIVNVGELATAVEERIRLRIVLFNDGGYGVLRNIQRAEYEGRVVAADLHTPDFVALVRSMGGWAFQVTDIAQFADAFEEAQHFDGPALVELDMTSIGDFAVPFGGPAR